LTLAFINLINRLLKEEVMRKFWFLSLLLITSSGLLAQSALEQADALWEKRGENFNAQTLLADPGNIDQAIKLYQEALAPATGDVKAEVTWKLIRAYYFKGNYTTKDSEGKKAIFDQGKVLGEKAIVEFPDSPGINLFTAIVWGVWGEEYGLVKAATEGVAGKIKKYCEKVIELDPNYDNAGGYRVLGRVYFKAPKIPLILGWPSNDKAIEFLEKGLQIAPDNLITQQFLAEALYKDGQKERAIQLLNAVLATTELVGGVAEDADTKNEVKQLLAEWKE
jgi:tetratricopeptide (TPR) repeat protein